jgi:hypothetical protein
MYGQFHILKVNSVSAKVLFAVFKVSYVLTSEESPDLAIYSSLVDLNAHTKGMIHGTLCLLHTRSNVVLILVASKW